jgi:hypothetical protein
MPRLLDQVRASKHAPNVSDEEILLVQANERLRKALEAMARRIEKDEAISRG